LNEKARKGHQNADGDHQHRENAQVHRRSERRIVLAEAHWARQQRVRDGKHGQGRDGYAHDLQVPRLSLKQRTVGGQAACANKRHDGRDNEHQSMLDLVLAYRPGAKERREND
jgi:hypothetical protein